MSPGASQAVEGARWRSRRRAGRFTLLALTLTVALAPAGQAQAAPSLGFENALTLAREGPSVAAAQLAVRSAEAARDATFGTVSAELQAGVSQSWSDAAGVTASRGGLEPFSLTATFNVVPYGPAFDARLDAEADLESARLALQDAVRTATADVARSYLLALRGQQRLELDQQAVDLAEATLDHVRSQRVSGNASDDEVAAADLALAQASTTLASDRLALQGSLADLADLVGQPVGRVAGEPPPSHDPAEDDVTVALERRSDVRQSALALASSRRAYTTALRSALPSARATADLQGGDGATSWSTGVAYGTSTFQPSLQASVTPSGSTTSGNGTVLQGTRFALSIGVTVPLDTNLGPALRSASLSVASAEQRLQRSRAQAALDVAAAERVLRSAHLNADLALAQQRRARSSATQAATRFDLGLVARPALEQARLAAATADLDALSVRDTVLLGQLDLAIALGLDPMEVF